MIPDDRRLRSGENPWWAIVAAWLLVAAILLATSAARIAAGEYHGPDDALRLVQVRDLIAGQGWFDLHQYRMTPPEGTLMHWSRLVDIPIAGMILFFSLFMDMPLAERAAMVVIPLIVLLLTMLAVGRLAWRMFDRQTAIFACLILLLLPMMAIQYQPMRIDHHGWQIFSVALAVWALSWRSAAQGGAVAGLAMAFGLMISLEVIFMSAAFGLVLAWRWLRAQRERWWLVSYLQALALGLVALFAATRGLPDLAAHCDVVSPPQLGFFLIVAIGVGALAVAPSIPRIPLIIGLAVVGLIGLVFTGWSAPQCLASPFSNLDPLVHDYWYLNVVEGRPFWYAPTINAIAAVVQPVLAIGLTIYIASRSRGWLREFWFEYALLLAIAYIAGLLTFRSIAFASVLAAIPLAWFVVRVFERWRSYTKLFAKLKLALVLYFVFLPFFPVVIYEQLIAVEEESPNKLMGRSGCELGRSVPLLNQLPAGRIFAPLDVGPVILYKTHHSVVASGHHRAETAMRDVIVGFSGPPLIAKQLIDNYDAKYVFVCTDLLEPYNYRLRGGDQALVSRLIDGDPPQWLEPIEIGGPDEFRAWRVIRD